MGRPDKSGRPGRPGGMIQREIVVTPALQAASGVLSMRQVAGMLEISYSQLYRWISEWMPIISAGRAFRLDAEALRVWMRSRRPWAWVPRVDDGLVWGDAEYDRRLAACRQMLERWGVQASR